MEILLTCALRLSACLQEKSLACKSESSASLWATSRYANLRLLRLWTPFSLLEIVHKGMLRSRPKSSRYYQFKAHKSSEGKLGLCHAKPTGRTHISSVLMRDVAYLRARQGACPAHCGMEICILINKQPS